jgi:hypothetical protein
VLCSVLTDFHGKCCRVSVDPVVTIVSDSSVNTQVLEGQDFFLLIIKLNVIFLLTVDAVVLVVFIFVVGWLLLHVSMGAHRTPSPSLTETVVLL